MKEIDLLSECGGCPMHRRGFLAAGCAACAGAVAPLVWSPPARAADNGKLRVRIVYSLHAEVQPGPDWPNVGFDFRPVMEQVSAALAQGCPNVEFLASQATGPEQAAKILEQDKAAGIDGYVVYQMNCWNRVVQTMVTPRQAGAVRRLPVCRQWRVSRLHVPDWRRAIRTSDSCRRRGMEDVVEAARCSNWLPKAAPPPSSVPRWPASASSGPPGWATWRASRIPCRRSQRPTGWRP